MSENKDTCVGCKYSTNGEYTPFDGTCFYCKRVAGDYYELEEYRYLEEGETITAEAEYRDGLDNWLKVDPRLSNTCVGNKVGPNTALHKVFRVKK